jgi:RNA polymerase sigma factor (TIGR02999 family)
MSKPEKIDITRLLSDVTAGDQQAADQLLPLVYDQLRAIARQRMNDERTGHTLQATALVHEVYLRLAGGEEIGWESRAHFYFAAAEAMRRILIEHARSRGRVKRGGGCRRVPINIVDLAAEQNFEKILAVDDALCRLDEQDARAAGVVRLRIFAGLSVEETARAMNLSERTVMRDWSFARAWLYNKLKEDDS